MKKFSILILLCCFTFSFTTIAMSQIYFEDDFDNVNKSQEKWVALYGTWEFKDKEYHQLLNDSNCMSIVTDKYWDEDWNDYTFEVRGNKISGAEGFLIMFRCQGTMNPRGKNLEEHPARMKGQQFLEYWWNLGGWGNSVSRIEVWENDIGNHRLAAESSDTINTNEWYNIKIVNTPTSYTLIINDEEVHEINDNSRDGVGRIGVATWNTTAKYDDVLVYGPKGALPVDPKGKIATSWGLIKAGR